MRCLAIGDIHGCFAALETLAVYVPIRPDDAVVTLGDYVDRGPDTRRVLDWLIARSKTPDFYPLRGNHDIMMLQAREGGTAQYSWLQMGGDAALASYARSGKKPQLSDVAAAHWDFLQNGLLDWHETATHFFVHANAYHDHPLDEQPDCMRFWEKFGEPRPHMSGKIMVCGHTPQKSGVPKNLGHAVCIDTWIYGAGWLTCLDVATGEYWQANQRGETRRDRLQPVEH